MWKPLMLFLAFLIGIFLWYFSADQQTVEKPSLVGRPAPAFQTHDLNGGTFSSDDVLGKKVVLVNFWASWCRPCQDEMPILNSLYKSLDEKDFQLVSMMEDDAADDEERRRILEKFKRKIPIDFPVYADKEQRIADLYGTYKIPETYLIDKSGVVVYKVEGMVTQRLKEQLIAKIRRLAK